MDLGLKGKRALVCASSQGLGYACAFALVREGATVMSTSTRNFPNRLGKNTFVYLGSAELAAICSKLGHIPSLEEYKANIGILDEKAADVYRYLNFDTIADYQAVADQA